MKQAILKLGKRITNFTAATGCFLLLGAARVQAQSQTYTNLKLFSGTKNLISAGTGALTALIALLTGFFGVKAVIAWQAAGDDEKPRKAKAVAMTIGIGVFGTCVAGLITWVLAFYA